MITDLFLKSDRFEDEYPAFILVNDNGSSSQYLNLFTAVAIFDINGSSRQKCIDNMRVISDYEESCREWFNKSPFDLIRVSIRGENSVDKFERMLKIVEHSLHRSRDHTISQADASFTEWNVVRNRDFTFRTDFTDGRLDTLPVVNWMHTSSVRFSEDVHTFVPYILHSFMKFDEVNTGHDKLIDEYVMTAKMDDTTYRIFKTICELVDSYSPVAKLDGDEDFLEYLYFSEAFLNPIIYHYRPHIIKSIFEHPLRYSASMYECRKCLHPYGLTFAITRMLSTLDNADTFEDYWIEYNRRHGEKVPKYCTIGMLNRNPDVSTCMSKITKLEGSDNHWALAMLSRIRIIEHFEKYDGMSEIWKYMNVGTTMFNAVYTDDLSQYIISKSKHFPFPLNSSNAFRLFGIYIRGKNREAIGNSLNIPRLLHSNRTDFYLRTVMLYSGYLDRLCDTDTESLRLYVEYGIFNGYMIPAFPSFFVYVVNAITPTEQRDIHRELHSSDYFYAWVMCSNTSAFSEIDMIGLLHSRHWRDSGPITYLLNFANDLPVYKSNLLTLRKRLPKPEMYEDRLIVDTFHPVLKTGICKDVYLHIFR
jgi:hypothetical protein